MRGYFGIGVEGLSKAHNLGALMRTGHAFGASFTFTVAADTRLRAVHETDTSKTSLHVPHYAFDGVDALMLPRGCRLVGVELTADAIDLPEFRHPTAAAYVLGRELGNLSDAMLARCDHVVKIPTAFCLNVSVAGALIMYDRMTSVRAWRDRPLMPGGPPPETWELRQGRGESLAARDVDKRGAAD
jgi:tRNA G18 (ribose-2'-O)-methylase SpoU